MYKLAWLVVATVTLVSCSKGDECTKATDHMIPAMEKMAGGKKVSSADRDKMLSECKEELAKGSAGKDVEVIHCLAAADDDAAVAKCMDAPMKDYASKSKKTEAQLMLNKLSKNSKVYFVTNASYLAGSAGPTPATPCCKGPGGRCPIDTSWGSNAVWSGLDFQIDEPTRFQYTYQSDGKTVTATAVGDPDCDGKTITYTLKMSLENGNPTSQIDTPAAP